MHPKKLLACAGAKRHACPDNNAMNAKPRKLGFVRISAGRSQAPILPAKILLESCKSCGSVILDVIRTLLVEIEAIWFKLFCLLLLGLHAVV